MIRLAALLLLVTAAAPAFATPSQVKPSNDSLAFSRQMVEQIMDEFEAELMAPGPAEPGWNAEGVDAYALLSAAPGGTAGNYLLSTTNDGSTSLTILDAKAVQPLLPKDWVTGRSFGPAFRSGLPIAVQIVDGQTLFVSWAPHRKVGKAFCSVAGIGGLQLRDPRLADGAFPTEVAEILLESIVRRAEAMTVCWRFDRAGEEFRVRYFLPDGRTLPAFDADEERVRIVPAAALDRLLRPATTPGEPVPIDAAFPSARS